MALMADKKNVYEAAAQLYQQYGADAEIIATMRAAEFAAQMDVEALHLWDAIIEELQRFSSEDAPSADTTLN
jgi:hypothetical protein